SAGPAFSCGSSDCEYFGTQGVGLWNWALDINSAGQVVGQSYVERYGSVRRGFLYSGGVLTLIPGSSIATGINDAGQVVGVGDFPFLYSGGVVTDLRMQIESGRVINLGDPAGI